MELWNVNAFQGNEEELLHRCWEGSNACRQQFFDWQSQQPGHHHQQQQHQQPNSPAHQQHGSAGSEPSTPGRVRADPQAAEAADAAGDAADTDPAAAADMSGVGDEFRLPLAFHEPLLQQLAAGSAPALRILHDAWSTARSAAAAAQHRMSQAEGAWQAARFPPAHASQALKEQGLRSEMTDAEAACRGAKRRAALLAALQALQGHAREEEQPTAQERADLEWVAQKLKAPDAASYVLGLHLHRSAKARLSALPDEGVASRLGPFWSGKQGQALDTALLLVSYWMGSKLAGGIDDVAACPEVAAAVEQPALEVAQLEWAVVQLLDCDLYGCYGSLLKQLR